MYLDNPNKYKLSYLMLEPWQKHLNNGYTIYNTCKYVYIKHNEVS